MPRNGSGTYSIPNTFLPNTTILSSLVNGNFSDIATAMTGSLPRDGQAGMTGPVIGIAGSATAPAFKFSGSTQTGFYRSAADQISASTAGVERIRFKADGTIRGAADALLWAQLGASTDVQGVLAAANNAGIRTALGLGSLATLSTVGAAEITDASVGTLELADNAVTSPKIADGSVTSVKAGAGISVQTIISTVNTVGTTGSVIPFDDTIPQNTEGAEILTATITPTSATSKLVVDVVFHCAANGAGTISAAIFQDSTVDAISVGTRYTGGGEFGTLSYSHVMTSGTTSATTFRLRVGAVGVLTTTINGVNGSRRFGGALISSLRITEIKG